MASEIVKVLIEAGTFVDLYSAAGTTSGTVLTIDTSYSSKVFLISADSEPTSINDNPYQLLEAGNQMSSEGDEVGLYAFSYKSIYINVIVG